MTPETEEVLKALNIIPNVPETKTLNYRQVSKQDTSGISSALRVGSDILMTT
jgi:hypothetical protein